MEKDRKTLIGRTFPPIKCVIDEEVMETFMRISGETHPAYESDENARMCGYERRVIPPSYGPFLALLLRSFDWEKDFFLDIRTGTAVFGEQELEYMRPLYFGETLMVQGKVVGVTEKQGKKLFDLIRMTLTAKDEEGETAFHGIQEIVIFK